MVIISGGIFTARGILAENPDEKGVNIVKNLAMTFYNFHLSRSPDPLRTEYLRAFHHCSTVLMLMSCAALSALSAPGIALIEPRCDIFQETLRTLRALDPCRRAVLTFMSLYFVRFGSRSLWRRVDCDVCYTTPLLTLCMRLRACVYVGSLSVLIATSVAQDALRGLCFMILQRLL